MPYSRARQQQKVAPYLKHLPSPSADFSLFLEHYFLGEPMLRGRGEEDLTVWDRLRGEELEAARQLILDHLGECSAYLRAAGRMGDRRAVPGLQRYLETSREGFSYERFTAARALYNLTGFPGYFRLLEEELPGSGQFTKISLDQWLEGLDKRFAVKIIFIMLQDGDRFVRFCAFSTLEHLIFGRTLANRKNSDPYVADEVYFNINLFRSRLGRLRELAEQAIAKTGREH